MVKRFLGIKLSTCLCWVLLAGPAVGQVYVTKSGTAVAPAPRVPAKTDGPATAKNTATTANDPTAGTFIAVVPDDLTEAVQPLLQWKRQQGFRVEVLPVGSLQRDSLRYRLQQRYENASPLRPAQRYVLLVGDVDRLQSFIGRHIPSGLNTHVTDLYYGEYTGDYLPEAQVGRLSVTDSTQLALVVRKIIDYEQGRWAASPSQVLLTAGQEQTERALRTTNGQVNYLSRMTAAHRPWLDTVCFYNPASDSLRSRIVQALEEPNALVSYSAHCTRSGWHKPTVTLTTLDSIENPAPALFVNNCCLSGAFDGHCFSEELLRRATGGAAGVIGASNETLWDEDFYWAVGAKYPISQQPSYDPLWPGAFDGLLTQSQGLSLGEMMQAGARAVTLAGSPFDAFYWEVYNLLGDPSMVPFMGHPTTLTLTVADTLTAGSEALTVYSTPGARVSITQDTLLLGTATADTQGIAHIPLFHALQGDSLTLTATRPGDIATTMVRHLQTPTTGRLAVTGYRTEGDRLQVEVRNMGATEATFHHLVWQQDSADRREGSRWEGVRTDTLSLPISGDTTLEFDMNSLSAGALPIFRIHLTMSDSNGQYGSLPLAVDWADPQPHIQTMELLDTSAAPVRQLEPDRCYLLRITLDRPADSATLTLNGTVVSRLATEDSTLLFAFTAPDTSYYALLATLYKTGRPYLHEGWLTSHRACEGFETGNMERYPWSSGGLYPWRLDSTVAHDGQMSLRSGAAHDNQQSMLCLDVVALVDDSVTFYCNVSSEANDWLLFYVDDRKYGFWSGNSGWKRFACPIRRGQHRLRWIYQKDASRTERNDCAWLDDIQLPLCWWNAPYGTVCGDNPAAIEGPETRGNTAATLRLYPNPTHGSVTVEAHSQKNDKQMSVTVFDAMGKPIDEIFLPPESHSTQYDTHHLRLGIYYLVLHDTDGVSVQKLIVTH